MTARPLKPERNQPVQPSLAQPDDGTQQLLQWGGSMVGVGLLAAALLYGRVQGYL